MLSASFQSENAAAIRKQISVRIYHELFAGSIAKTTFHFMNNQLLLAKRTLRMNYRVLGFHSAK